MRRSDTVPSLMHLSFAKVWGFAELNGERRHVRRIRMTGKDNEASYFRLVYDYGECTLADPLHRTYISQSDPSEDELDALLLFNIIMNFR